MCTPGGDEFVETLSDFSLYAQIVRQARYYFAYRGEVEDNVVLFSEVISDDEMIRLIRAGQGWRMLFRPRRGALEPMSSSAAPKTFCRSELSCHKEGGLRVYGGG